MIKKLVLIALLLLSLYFPFSMVVAEAKDMNLYYILNKSNELKEKMNTNQLVYIYFFKDDCTACSSFKEVLNSEIEKKGLKIYAVNINNKAMKYFDLVKKYNLTKTPTLICFKNNKELKRKEGYVSEEKLDKFVEGGAK